MKHLASLLIASTVAGCATSSDTANDGVVNTAAVISMAPEQLVAGRRATFFLSTRAVGQIKDWTEGGGDQRQARVAAMQLSNWAAALPGMFPAGSGIEESRALPTVWSDRPGFEAAATAYRDSARSLAELIATDDREAAAVAFLAMADNCHACHTSYREPDES